MKTLLIARHGKSSWISSEIEDIDRSLDISGVHGVQNVANSLKNKNILPDLILSSPATRAIHTALIHSRVLEINEDKIKINSSIYYKRENQVLELISKQNPSVFTLMVCGHNPTSTHLVNFFLPIPIENLQTSGVVQLNFNIENWEEITPSKPAQAFYFKRKETVELI